MPPVFSLLKQQRSEIDEVIETIYNNIAQHRADFQICLPELRMALLGLTEDHFIDAKILAKELGEDHALVREIEHDAGNDWIGFAEEGVTNQSLHHPTATDASNQTEGHSVATAQTDQTAEKTISTRRKENKLATGFQSVHIVWLHVPLTHLQHILWQQMPPASLQLNPWLRMPLSSLQHTLW